MLLRALHMVTRIFLLVACAFWALICLEILPAMLLDGMDAARTKLVHIWSIGKIDLQWSCQESLQLLHEGYTDLIVLLLLTWALVEVKRFLDRRIVSLGRATHKPPAHLPELR